MIKQQHLSNAKTPFYKFANPWMVIFLLLLSIQVFAQNTPLGINGRLKLKGLQLSNEYGNPVQLRGMSTHGLQWFWGCINNSSMDILAKDWGADIIRAAMYVDEGGYMTDKSGYRDKVNQIVDMAGDRGMYAIIDWHILTPGNPWDHINDAKEFFTIMASRNAGKKHVLYEICNEPNGIDWLSIKGYAEQIIPIIRQYDKEAIIIVGTPNWSGSPDVAIANPLTGSNAYNVMYTFHFYAGSSYNQSYLDGVISKVPVFVTEWGVSNYSGNGGNDYNNSQSWLNLLAGQNSSGVKISWCNWNFSDGGNSTDALNQGACSGGNWNNTKYNGSWVKDHLLNPADNFNGNNNNTTDEKPYLGNVVSIPGIIEAENYDDGGEGVSYHDTESSNLGGKYRTNYGVDVESCSEGGYDVGWINSGEWLNYTVNVINAGSYKMDIRLASASTGGNFHVEFNGTNVSGTINAPGTSGWQTWTTVSTNVNLSAGQQIMKIYFEGSSFNINNITFSSNTTVAGITNGRIYKIVSKYSGLACDVEGVSKDNGANVQQWSYGGGSNQQWRADDLGNGYWRFISINSNKCLEVAGMSNDNGGNVQQWDWVGHNYQQWSVSAIDGGAFKVINRGSGKSLDVSGISMNNGANIWQWDYVGGENQKWFFQPVDGVVLKTANQSLANMSASTTLFGPNPASDFININGGSFSDEVNVSISDMNGNVVLQKAYSNGDLQVDLNTVPQGVYVLVIKDQYTVRTEKLVVQK